jgi:hypothetical protein
MTSIHGPLGTFGDFKDQPSHGKWQLFPNPPVLGENPHLRGGGMAWVAILAAPPPPPHTGNSSFLPLPPYLNDICPFFLLLFVPLDAALLFDVNAAIMGWLLLAVQP